MVNFHEECLAKPAAASRLVKGATSSYIRRERCRETDFVFHEERRARAGPVPRVRFRFDRVPEYGS